ncbi:non-hydrolyzing UDP-N-acetylglucosamine 2-epimerase [Nautilia sp.]
MKILFIFGTRPEAIKLAPLIYQFKQQKGFEVSVCITAQHREMLDQVLSFFKIKSDYDLNIMKPNQSLFTLSSDLIKMLEKVLEDCNPDIVFVQGDTTTAFFSALASFYKKIKVAHVEAGLRSQNKYSPFPEEVNRVLIGHIADYHFAPTEQSKQNLLNEGIAKNVWVVGNTVIDALFLGLKIIKNHGEDVYFNFFDFIDFSKKIILVTGHRRENFGKPFEEICFALKEIADLNDDVEIVYPVHLNPNVREPVKKIIGTHPKIKLIEPLNYPYFIWLMSKSYLILTDSGGIQEEAPSLGKPVLVLREVTERKEGIKAGTSKLVGTKKGNIVKETLKLLNDSQQYQNMTKAVNPYGDGKTSYRILEILKEEVF